MHSIFACMIFFCFMVLCCCTDNLSNKEKLETIIYPPVHYSPTDTIPENHNNAVGETAETEVTHSPKIVHKALCRYTQLSVEFDFALSADMNYDERDVPIRLYIKAIPKKQDSVSQLLIIEEPDMLSNGFKCIGRSYSTGHNMDVKVDVENMGDIVVADLNFDGKEDFGVAKDNGFHVYYHFYLQDDKGHFKVNKYLTDNLMGFPNTIDTLNKTIETLNRWSYYGVVYNTFKYDKATHEYKEIRRQGFGGEKNELLMDWLNGIDNMKH